MVEMIKLLIGAIVGIMDALPQVAPDAAGTLLKIPDAEYNTLVANAVVGVVKGAGFQVAGFTDAQISGAAAAVVVVVRAYKTAARVPA